MLGAIIGDVVGSQFSAASLNTKTKNSSFSPKDAALRMTRFAPSRLLTPYSVFEISRHRYATGAASIRIAGTTATSTVGSRRMTRLPTAVGAMARQ